MAAPAARRVCEFGRALWPHAGQTRGAQDLRDRGCDRIRIARITPIEAPLPALLTPLQTGDGPSPFALAGDFVGRIEGSKAFGRQAQPRAVRHLGLRLHRAELQVDHGKVGGKARSECDEQMPAASAGLPRLLQHEQGRDR